MGFDSRETQEQQIDNNHGDIIAEASVKGVPIASYLQSLSPFPDDPTHPRSASGDYLARKGIPLRDDIQNGVQSAPMCKIYEDSTTKSAGPVATVWAGAVNESVKSAFRGYKEMAKLLKALESAAVLETYDPGSAIRPYADSPFRDGDMRTIYPPLERIAGTVTRQRSDSIRVVEYEKDPNLGERYKGEPPYEVSSGADRPLRVPKEKESKEEMKIYADGLLIDDKMRTSGTYTSEMVMTEAQKYAAAVGMLMGRECIRIAFAAADVTPVGTEKLDLDDLMGIVFSVRPPYEITSIFGDEGIIKEYAGIPRDQMYAPSATMQTKGSVIGSDTWGRSTIGRMFYDVEATVLNEAAHDEKLLCLDARDTVEVKIREGSDMATDTFNTRNRCHELVWDIEFGVNLMVEKPKALLVISKE